jgi:hypothetical protein
MSTVLNNFLANATEPLVLIDGTVPGFAESLDLPDATPRELLSPQQPLSPDVPFKALILCVPDRGALRRVIGLVPGLGNARTFVVYVAQTTQMVTVVPRPEWPEVKVLWARKTAENESITIMRLDGAISAQPVLAEFARQVTSQHERGEGNLVVGLAGVSAAHLPAGDSATAVGMTLDEVVRPDLEVPPDIVLAADEQSVDVNEILGRAPVVVNLEAAPAPIDELVINPIGYAHEPAEPVADLQRLGATWRVKGAETDLLVDATVGLTDQTVAQLRALRGVRVTWPAEQVPGLRRLVAGMSMAGVPVVSDAVPDWARPLLGGLADVITRPVDLDEGLRRDEHSVLLRRAAFAEHSTWAWRRALASRAGVTGPEFPSVSILLATKRPHEVLHAIRQVRHQRGVQVELVLATHGFEFPADQVREAAGDLSVVHLDFPESTPFGDVLTAAAKAASGDLLLKFDDDDWYGPDAVTDLLMARRYSGAAVVGMPAEFTYLAPVDTTIRRNDRTEFFARFIAGGTIMIDRPLLRSVGYFRQVRKYVDLQLLTAVQAAGASIYRTHGLGYLMARSAEGHTWNPGLDYFLAEERVGTTYPGFSPSLLMELPEPD